MHCRAYAVSICETVSECDMGSLATARTQWITGL